VLLRQQGLVVNHKRLLRLMREDNLLCLRRRAFVPMTTQSDRRWPMMPNLVHRLEATAPDQIWVADITYIRLREGFVYLAVVLDAFSRKVVGLAVEALQQALATRWPPRGMIHHSDQGTQCACEEYRLLLERHGLQASMSRVGNPYDNAKAESFMATLKREQIDGWTYRDLAEAKADIGPFIDSVYDRQRLHSELGYRSPEQFEMAVLNQGEGGAARSQGSAPPSPKPLVKPQTQQRQCRLCHPNLVSLRGCTSGRVGHQGARRQQPTKGQSIFAALASLRQSLPTPQSQAHPHKTLYPTNQRQGRALHPDFVTRMRLRPCLSELQTACPRAAPSSCIAC
jgi:transposase InsO family protein